MALDRLVVGTRGSALALWQAHHVQALLMEAGISVDLDVITTTGDRRLDVPLASIGEKGLFTREIDDALLSGQVHLAVHSLKDLPSRLPDGIRLAAVTRRAAPWDAFVSSASFKGSLEELPEAAVVATSSLRRQSQLKAWRPDLQVVPVRGNVDTRLRKLDESGWHGMILAEAGLVRLGLSDRITQRMPQQIMLPAVGQGALGIVCSDDSEELAAILEQNLHHEETAAATRAERAFLRRLEGGCSVPVAAYATIEGSVLHLEGCVASVDGRELLREEETGLPADAESMGTALAERLLGRGAREILTAIRPKS